MISGILKFFTGTTFQLNNMTYGLDQYIALNSQTGQLYWHHAGQKYYLKYPSDWEQSDSSTASFIRNKPHLLTIEDLIDVLDVSQLADATKMITPYSMPIDPAGVVNQGNGKYTYQIGKRMPNGVFTQGMLYSIQNDTITVDANGNITIQLSNYMAYQNITTIPTNWKLFFA